jgi:DNA-binding NarL/FixJ family response regulator
MAPRILLIDDHPLFRREMAGLLRDTGILVDEAADADSALQQVSKLLPDIVLLDMRLDPGRWTTLIAQLLEAHPKVRIIVLGLHAEPEFQRAAQTAGAHGYLSKDAVQAKLLTVVRAVWAGQRYFELDSMSKEAVPLASREREVVQGVALGYTNREIAERLDLSIKSIECYRARVMQKLGFSSRAELVRYAVRCGLLDRERS